MRLRFLSLLWLAAPLMAQEPLNRPVPLVAPVPAVDSAGQQMASLLAAQRAQELGFPSVAASLYQQLLQAPGGDRNRLVLGLASALLDDGRLPEADLTLQSFVGLRGSAWHLRAGLVAAQGRRFEPARAEAALVKVDELSAADRGWYFFLQGLLADAAGDLVKARGLHEQAEATATSELARARFLLAREQARLRSGPVNETLADEARKNLDRYQGRKIGYDYARTYAVMLDALGRKNDAVAVLTRQLFGLPPDERAAADDFRLLMGLIAGAEEGAGRTALAGLLATGNDAAKQRVALQLLARASTKEPARGQFRTELDKLIGASTAHAILEDLLLFRAQVALSEKNYTRAEDDARELLQKFPGSALKAHAFGVLTGAAWEQRRYRAAADLATKARAELTSAVAGTARAELGVLIAEAWFRARDFRSAADAYAAALRERPERVAAGDLMFQRVLAEIEADRTDVAQPLLDELARDPAMDALNRWQAEWNLARALQLRGAEGIAQAFARVTRLLATDAAPVNANVPAVSVEVKAQMTELRARFAWLQAQLSFEAEKPKETLSLVDKLDGQLSGAPAALKTEIASSGALLRAQALFALGSEGPALEQLKKLRTDFPKADAAVYSYIVEADHYATLYKTVEAQQLFTKLADDFPKNTYAPYALYLAALQAERRGQEDNFKEAVRLIEQLVTKYPDSDQVFAARLEQGDLLRKLNYFPQAQQVYESLVNNYATRPGNDVLIAQLKLAECHNAQAANDPVHAERAATIFEHLRDRVDAPTDLRAEAGFNLGYTLARRGQAQRAQEVWWRDVVTAFLLDETKATELKSKGHYWIARTLLEVGTLFEQQGKLEEAKEAWQLILKKKLNYGQTIAKQQLARFNLPEAKP